MEMSWKDLQTFLARLTTSLSGILTLLTRLCVKSQPAQGSHHLSVGNMG